MRAGPPRIFLPVLWLLFFLAVRSVSPNRLYWSLGCAKNTAAAFLLYSSKLFLLSMSVASWLYFGKDPLETSDGTNVTVEAEAESGFERELNDVKFEDIEATLPAEKYDGILFEVLE